MNLNPKCECAKESCPENCDRKHIHKTIWCDECQCPHRSYKIVMDGSPPKCTKCDEVVGCSTGTCRVLYCKTCFPKEGDIQTQESPEPSQEKGCRHEVLKIVMDGRPPECSKCGKDIIPPQDSAQEKEHNKDACWGYGCKKCFPDPKQSWEERFCQIVCGMYKFIRRDPEVCGEIHKMESAFKFVRQTILDERAKWMKEHSCEIGAEKLPDLTPEEVEYYKSLPDKDAP